MQSYKIKTKDELSLQIQQWNKSNNIKANILIIHGLGEHQGRYNHVADYYTNHKFGVYSYDQRGHGKSEGKRGHSPGIEFSLNDLERVIKTLPSKPLFIYGHSFGGNILTNFLLRKKPKNINGAILSAPWFKLVKQLNPLEKFLIRILNNIAPSLTQNNRLNENDLSHDESICKTYINDPLRTGKVSIRLFHDFFKSGIWAIENATNLSTKTLLIHGSKDLIVDKNGTLEFAKNAGKICDYKIFSNTKHEPHNDFTKEEVLSFTLNWLQNNLNTSF